MIRILYGSQKGACLSYAKRVQQEINTLINEQQTAWKVEVTPCSSLDAEDLNLETVVILLCSTYTDGTPPDNAKAFCSWLDEASVDFRVGPEWLSKVAFGAFGAGNSIYDANYNVVARQLYKNMIALGGVPLCSLGQSDENVSRADVTGTAEKDFVSWLNELLLPAIRQVLLNRTQFLTTYKQLKHKHETTTTTVSDASSSKRTGSSKEEEEEAEAAAAEAEEDEYDEEEQDDGGDVDEEGEKVVDMEDLGKSLKKPSSSSSSSSSSKIPTNPAERRPMLTDQLRKSLTKQGYKLLGSHSGVKLCRWTKAMLRGRGGCYKHTFYGIMSYQCMEMTPSLACANKCVFCWRHHTNPVGREWRWQVDEPEMLVEQAMQQHAQMINVFKGVPGVKPERLKQAQQIKHCALSLVGEPIMYPHINRFIELLHRNGVSTFLVTNAQFPDRIRDCDPVSQLYVSVDASTRESLKTIDRPLFSDFWERYLASLEAIRHKRQRTVYRLTLVKAFNMAELAEYAKLIMIGQPTFIEIKGVTFCGKNDASPLTMSNVPFHTEVRSFGEALCTLLPPDKYALAAEHEHSCGVLIADTKLRIEGRWHTHIDYAKFNQCVLDFYASNKQKQFDVLDYAAPTPEWALYGAKEKGFDPSETRVKRVPKVERRAAAAAAATAAAAAAGSDLSHSKQTPDDDDY